MTGSIAMTSDTVRLDGKVAIVTGPGRGIGFATASALAAAGAKVVVNDSGAAAVEQAVENIRASGGSARLRRSTPPTRQTTAFVGHFRNSETSIFYAQTPELSGIAYFGTPQTKILTPLSPPTCAVLSLAPCCGSPFP